MARQVGGALGALLPLTCPIPTGTARSANSTARPQAAAAVAPAQRAHCVQLRRFSFRNFIWRDKINDLVEFRPVSQGSAACSPRAGGGGGRAPARPADRSRAGSAGTGQFCIGQKRAAAQPDLYAVINLRGHDRRPLPTCARLPNDRSSQRSDVRWHTRPAWDGREGGGAQFLFTLSPRLAVGWRLFDDSTVATVDESQVVITPMSSSTAGGTLPWRGPRAGHSEHHPDLGPAAESAASQVRHREASQGRPTLQMLGWGRVEHSFFSFSP